MENMGLLLEKMVENNMQLTRGQEDLNLTISGLIEKTGAVSRRVGELRDEVFLIKDGYTNVNMRMDNLELNSEIDDVQVKTITESVKSRVYDVLKNEPHDIVGMIYMAFIRKAYYDLKKNHGLGSKIAVTKKRDYERVMQGIDGWYPSKYQDIKNKAIASHEQRMRDKASINAMAIKEAIENLAV